MTSSTSPFQKFLHFLFALSPTAIASYLSQWLGLFGKAGLAHRDFQPQVERLALGVSTIAVLIIYGFFHKATARTLKIVFVVAVLLFGGSLIGCISLNYILYSMITQREIEATIYVWQWMYFAFLLFTSVLVISFMLYVLKEGP
jgi:hypothetical protein